MWLPASCNGLQIICKADLYLSDDLLRVDTRLALGLDTGMCSDFWVFLCGARSWAQQSWRVPYILWSYDSKTDENFCSHLLHSWHPGEAKCSFPRNRKAQGRAIGKHIRAITESYPPDYLFRHRQGNSNRSLWKKISYL